MNRRDILIETIVKECTDEHGFVVDLRAGEFSQEKYNNLIKALQEFMIISQDDEFIEKSVAYSLYALNNGLYGAYVYASSYGSKDFNKQIEEANQKCFELIINILEPKNYYRNRSENKIY